ncbi:hypothetical protein QR98_0088890 [Sarcoptes scabiei]|uniref:Uncharacterized protein n=1 Tax=Sarcoptes scabiei TaxID=52283 RepID=A0A132AIE6_SARSC|nr:hypothetical protein QR98_0088890 [Sarcoptes scabiei]
MKLKQLQNDWLICTKDEKIVLVDDENKLIYLDGFSKLCGYANSYQTRRFLFFDGKNDLTKFFEEIYQSIHDETANNFNNSLMTNIYDLEEDFLETDKRSSQTLSQISEAVNMRAKRYRKRVQALEEENQSLKKRLEDEEIDDEVLEQHYQSKLLRLEEENQQLKSLIKFEDEQDLEKTKKLESKIDELVQNNHRLQQFLDFLERQIIMGQEIENSLDYSRKIYDSRNRHKLDSLMMDDSREKNQYNLIRQKINQLMHENEELKSKIALYRWTDSGKFSQNTDGTQSEEKKLKQMKIRLKIMEKKLSTFNENNEKLKQINRQLNDSNNKLKGKLYEANLHQIKNSLDKEPFIEKENFISKATHSNKKNEHKENLKSAASISERIKETYQWLSKQFTLNNGDWAKAEMPKIFELGSELVKSTTNKMQVLTEILSEGKLSSVNKQSDYLVDYLTDNINKFSNIIDKSLRSVLNEMKENLQYINQNKDSLEKNRMEQDQLRHLDDLHMNMDSDSLREEHSMIKKKQSRKRFRKITDKEMLKIKSNSNWLINRSKLREDARLSKLSAMQATAKNSNAWLMRRAKAREKYRNEQSDKK